MLTVGVISFLVSQFIVSPYLVVGESMLPTLHDLDLCLAQKTWSYRPQRGDVVVFRTVDSPPLYFVKRVIALPGETIRLVQGVVLIDGTPLDEPYTTPNQDWNLDPALVPAGKVFVLGDNRAVPLEATVHGLVATRLVRARLIAHWRWKR